MRLLEKLSNASYHFHAKRPRLLLLSLEFEPQPPTEISVLVHAGKMINSVRNGPDSNCVGGSNNIFANVYPYQIPMRSNVQLPGGFAYPGGFRHRNPPSEYDGSRTSTPNVDPILSALTNLTDQMKSMSAVLKDVHDISHQHSVKLREHSNSIQDLYIDEKPVSNQVMENPYLRHFGPTSQASTRETTPLTRPTLPGVPGRVASVRSSNSLGSQFAISVPQPYRITPPVISAAEEEVACQPPVPISGYSPRSPNTTMRSIKTPTGIRQRRPSMAEAANVHKTPASSRSVAAVSRGRLIKSNPVSQASGRSKSPAARGSRTPATVSTRLTVPTASSERRAKSPARTMAPKPTSMTSYRAKSPARVVTMAQLEGSSPRPTTPLIRYEVHISYNDHLVAKSQIKPAMSEDGPFLYVIQSEMDPALSFIPHPDVACSFSGLSISVVATNTRTRQSNVIFKSHDSHVENPPVNETDGYFAHTCWLSGASASVVGSVRMFFRRQSDETHPESVTVYAMSLKFWFPETAENGLERAPAFTKDHYKELLRLLGLLK